MQTQVSLRPVYEPVLDWDDFTQNIGSLKLVYKNYVLFFKSEFDSPENRNIFHTFDLDSYELKEGRLKGNVPSKILDKGICFFDENTIFVIGYSEDSPTEDIFLFSIMEDPEEKFLAINSKVKYPGKDLHARFTEIHCLYKHHDLFYVIGNRVRGAYSRFVRGFWKLNRRSGGWNLLDCNVHTGAVSSSNIKKPGGFSSACSDGNLYIQGLQERNFFGKISHFWDLWELKRSKKNSVEQKKLKAGKVFSSKSWSTLGSYNDNLYLFVGEPFDENAKVESGLYQYDKEKDGWIKMQFRGVSPPKVGEHIFVPYKDSIFILSLNAGFSQIFRIIMDPSEHILKRKSSLANKELPDIILKVDGKEFYCHKAILSDASHFFSSMFNSGMKECFDKELDLPDVKASTFEIFLRYIYDDEALEIKEEFVRELYELSDRYLITGLNAECHEFLKRNLTLDNFGKIAEMAQEMGIEDLLEAATDYGLKNCGLLEEKHLESMSSSVLKKIICKCERIEVRKKIKK